MNRHLFERPPSRGALLCRQHVAAGPQSGAKRIGVIFRKSDSAHFRRCSTMIVVEPEMTDFEAAVFGSGRDNAEPNAGRPVIGGHADRARIVPELAVDDLREWQAAMTGYDSVDA